MLLGSFVENRISNWLGIGCCVVNADDCFCTYLKSLDYKFEAIKQDFPRPVLPSSAQG